MLTTKELVQINATIIGGILIFMTLALTSFSDKESSLYRFIITLITSSVLFPYALSAITAIDEKSQRSISFLKIGLAYSVVVGLIFVVLSYMRDILGIVRWSWRICRAWSGQGVEEEQPSSKRATYSEVALAQLGQGASSEALIKKKRQMEIDCFSVSSECPHRRLSLTSLSSCSFSMVRCFSSSSFIEFQILTSSSLPSFSASRTYSSNAVWRKSAFFSIWLIMLKVESAISAESLFLFFVEDWVMEK